MVKLTFIGHSAWLLDDGKTRIVIDPFITGNPVAAMQPSEIKTDYVIVTHGHGDHLGDAEAIAKANNATVIANNEIAIYLSGKGVNAHNMHIGGGFDFPFGRVKLTNALHGSALNDLTYLGHPAGVLLNFGGKTIYHAGDTALTKDMELLGEYEDVDIAMLPIGDNFTMGVRDASIAAKMVKPKIAIPMHYNTWPPIKADPEEFKRLLADTGIEVIIMNAGETREF